MRPYMRTKLRPQYSTLCVTLGTCRSYLPPINTPYSLHGVGMYIHPSYRAPSSGQGGLITMLVRVSLCAEIYKCPPSNRQSLGWAVETLESTTATHRVTIQRHGTVIGYCTAVQVKMEKGVGPSLEWRLCFEDCHRVRWSAVWCFANVMCLRAAAP